MSPNKHFLAAPPKSPATLSFSASNKTFSLTKPPRESRIIRALKSGSTS